MVIASIKNPYSYNFLQYIRLYYILYYKDFLGEVLGVKSYIHYNIYDMTPSVTISTVSRYSRRYIMNPLLTNELASSSTTVEICQHFA